MVYLNFGILNKNILNIFLAFTSTNTETIKNKYDKDIYLKIYSNTYLS